MSVRHGILQNIPPANVWANGVNTPVAWNQPHAAVGHKTRATSMASLCRGLRGQRGFRCKSAFRHSGPTVFAHQSQRDAMSIVSVPKDPSPSGPKCCLEGWFGQVTEITHRTFRPVGAPLGLGSSLGVVL